MGRAPFLIAAGGGESQFMLDVVTPTHVSSLAVPEAANPYGGYVTDDGTMLFIVGSSSDSVHRYDMSTAFDLTTATFVSTLDISSKETVPGDVQVAPDGTMLFIAAAVSGAIHRWDMATAYDLTSATFTSSFDASAEEGNPRGIHVTDDGTIMFVVGILSDSVHRYDISTAFDITTATYVSSLDVSTRETAPYGVHVTDDGNMLFVIGNISVAVHRYDLAIAYDLTSATPTSSFDVSAEEGSPRGIRITDDGTIMFVIGSNAVVSGNNVHRYDL